jgi:hypothetical protein
MGFWSRKKRPPWDPASVTPPWRSSVSIYRHVLEHVEPGGKGLRAGGERLPDETDDGSIKWVAGGLDGAFGHHATAGRNTEVAERVGEALRAALADADAASLTALYALLREASAVDYVDALLDDVSRDAGIDPVRLHALAEWLAREAPDREPVKVALALLGLSIDERDAELLRTLARHDELTLYATLALSKLRAGERHLFDLARALDGWGRIQLVERLATTRDPEIKGWLLREGYKNSVMYEYLAYTCATAGGLREALAEDRVDEALLAGAGDIIEALIAGGPAEDMSDYADGAAATELYLAHLGAEPRKLEQLLVVAAVLGFLDGAVVWAPYEAHGWTAERRAKMRERCVAIERLPHWPEIVRAGLASPERVAFARADQAARALGIDTWTNHFERLEAGDDDGWYFVMQTDDPDRVDRVLALASARIPLDAIATGPGDEIGLGPRWKHHGHLDFVLQELGRFPGKGWTLIRAGIRSPVVRNRHMALRALSAWGRARWPADARPLLEQAAKDDPDENVRAELGALLRGEPLERPGADSN